MVHRVWLEKLLLVRHIRSLDTDTLARSIYEEQKKMAWPGLAKETAEICRQLGIQDCNDANVWATGTKSYRNMIIEKCKELDKDTLEKEMTGKTKCERILIEGYGKKKYISENILKTMRRIFTTRVKLLPFGGNFKNDKRFAKTNWRCLCRVEVEEESHLLSGKCTVYGDLRSMVVDVRDDHQLATFFAAILERREQMEEPVVARTIATDSASP